MEKHKTMATQFAIAWDMGCGKLTACVKTTEGPAAYAITDRATQEVRHDDRPRWHVAWSHGHHDFASLRSLKGWLTRQAVKGSAVSYHPF